MLVFQGGFVGQDCLVELGASANLMKEICVLDDIQDSNDEQKFSFDISSSLDDEKNNLEHEEHSYRYLRLTFRSSTDFYGRVTIYNLQVFEDL